MTLHKCTEEAIRKGKENKRQGKEKQVELERESDHPSIMCTFKYAKVKSVILNNQCEVLKFWKRYLQ